MATEKESNDIELRVLDDEAAEEVIRLDEKNTPTGKSARPEKLTKMGVRPSLPDSVNQREAAIDPDDHQKKILDDLDASPNRDAEDDWMEKAEGQNTKKTPMGWFFLVGIVILGSLGWAISQVVKSEKVVATTQHKHIENTVIKVEEREDARAYYQQLEGVIKNYLKAESIEEKLKYVRQPDRVAPLMREYYARFPLKGTQFTLIDSFQSVSLDNYPFIVTELSTKEGNDVLLIEDGENGILVDWESDVVYQPMPIKEFIDKRMAGPIDFRVNFRSNNYFSREFSDTQKYSSYFITFKDSDEYLYAYAERDTDLDTTLRELCLANLPQGISSPALLALGFKPGSKAERSVIITAIHSRGWAYLNDPTKTNPNENMKGAKKQ